jgi:hypothetical protein
MIRLRTASTAENLEQAERSGMGWVMMSERELNRVEVLAQVDDGRLAVDNAANLMDLTRRQPSGHRINACQISKSSGGCPASTHSLYQAGCRPRPDHVRSGFSGCRYLGG